MRGDDAIFELVRIALDALAQLRLPDRDRQRARDLLRDFDRLRAERSLVGRRATFSTPIRSPSASSGTLMNERRPEFLSVRIDARRIPRLRMLRTMPACRSSMTPKASIGIDGALAQLGAGPSSCKAMICPCLAHQVEHGHTDTPARNQALQVTDRRLGDLLRRARAEDVEMDVVQHLQALVVTAQRADRSAGVP